jgi:hypothetical protein
LFPGDPATAPPHIASFVEIVRRLQAMRAGDLGERSVVRGDAARCTESAVLGGDASRLCAWLRRLIEGDTVWQ